MATETAIIERWLYSTLTNDGTLAAIVSGGWHRWRAAEGAAYPLGIFRFQGGSDLNAIGPARRVWVNALYAVYVVGAIDLEAAAARIDTLLNGKFLDVTGGRIAECTREAPLNLPLLENGVARELLGGTYRIRGQVV